MRRGRSAAGSRHGPGQPRKQPIEAGEPEPVTQEADSARDPTDVETVSRGQAHPTPHRDQGQPTNQQHLLLAAILLGVVDQQDSSWELRSICVSGGIGFELDMGNCCLSPEVVAREDVKTFPRPHHDHDTHPLANKNHLHQNGGGHSKRMAAVLSGDGRAVGGIEEKYVLDHELSREEFGVTYLCLDHFTGELLACKSISKRKLETAVDVEDVRREVAIMRYLPRNSSIVSLQEA
ncbi:hypothetical protein ZIOFF_031920 [Zingiber officinale]|uniref:Protein kinase domain-containing protein n=1 Tax=Zingiber officinale TaxID=94328 RepID=A0A8J5GIB3_ZINOF|nr:hypothetical protein ZIOFF_031920 [Zingiber officinale]